MQGATPYRILIIPGTPEMTAICEDAGLEYTDVQGKIAFVSYLTKQQYSAQLMDADSKWICPITHIEGWFDDAYFEDAFGK